MPDILVTAFRIAPAAQLCPSPLSLHMNQRKARGESQPIAGVVAAQSRQRAGRTLGPGNNRQLPTFQAAASPRFDSGQTATAQQQKNRTERLSQARTEQDVPSRLSLLKWAACPYTLKA